MKVYSFEDLTDHIKGCPECNIRNYCADYKEIYESLNYFWRGNNGEVLIAPSKVAESVSFKIEEIIKENFNIYSIERNSKQNFDNNHLAAWDNRVNFFYNCLQRNVKEIIEKTLKTHQIQMEDISIHKEIS
jgi:hypothetical protein